MKPVTEQNIRRCMANCTRGEADSMMLPTDFADIDWSGVEFLGWRDRKAPLRGYLVRWVDDQLVGVALRAADSRMSSRVAAMCLLCQSVHAGADVSLFTARRGGRSGRDGNTVGTYMCADLDCATHLRAGGLGSQFRPLADRMSDLEERLDAFVREVLSTR